MYDHWPTRYQHPSIIDYGGGANVLQHVIGPKGKAGLLYDYGCHSVMEVFAAGTATPMISVGTTANPDAYGEEFDFGALTVAGGGKSIRTAYSPADAGWATYMVDRDLPADTVVMVTHVAGTGSGLTGQAAGFVDIIWSL